MVPSRASEFSTLDTLRWHQSNHFIPWSCFAKSQSHTLWSGAILECGACLIQRRRRSWCHSKGPGRAWDLAWLHLECCCPSKDQRPAFGKEGLEFFDCSLCCWKDLLRFLCFLGSFALVAFLTLVHFGLCSFLCLWFVCFGFCAFCSFACHVWLARKKHHPTIQQPGHTALEALPEIQDVILASCWIWEPIAHRPRGIFVWLDLYTWAWNLVRCRSETHFAWFLHI